MEEETIALRMICPHGKVRMLCSMRPEVLKYAKRDIAAMIMKGFTSDRVSVEIARQSDMDCPECDALYAKPTAMPSSSRIGAER